MKLFELFGEINIKDGKALDKLGNMDKKAKSLGSRLGGAAKKAAKFGAGIAAGAAAAGGAMFAMAKKTADSLDRVDKLSQKMGMSAETFQEWDFIASQSGASMESLKMGAKTLNMRMGDLAEGTGAGADAFKKLGISYSDVKDLSPEQQFETTIQTLQSMEDVTKRNAIASDLFGRAGQELIPLLNQEGGTIDELKAKAHELGMVQSEEAVKAGVVFSDTLDATTKMLKGMGLQIGTKLLPIINKFLEWIQANMPVIREKFQQAMDVIIPLVQSMYQTFNDDVLPILRTVFKWVKDNMPTFKKIFMAVFDAAKTSVTALWDILKVSLIPILKMLFGWVNDNMGTIESIVVGSFDAIKTIIETTTAVITTIIDTFKTAYEWARKFIGKAKEAGEQRQESTGSAWNDVKGMRADGGPVASGESYIVGERGPEIFTPSQSGNITSNEESFGNVVVKQMIVREEADIDKISRKLRNLQKQANRGYAL